MFSQWFLKEQIKGIIITPEESAVYVETVRQRNAANAKKYYETKIKSDPEKYNKFLNKCRVPNRKYYHSNR
jgi:hypothetical protein